MLLAALDASIVGTAMPTVVASLGGLEIFSWVFAGYALVSTTAMPFFGRLSDVYGRKRLYLLGLGLFVVASGLCEVGGAAAFVLGARHSIAVTSVLASQFAALAAVAAFVLFRERLTRVQLAGIAIIAAGVAALSALQA